MSPSLKTGRMVSLASLLYRPSALDAGKDHCACVLAYSTMWDRSSKWNRSEETRRCHGSIKGHGLSAHVEDRCESARWDRKHPIAASSCGRDHVHSDSLKCSKEVWTDKVVRRDAIGNNRSMCRGFASLADSTARTQRPHQTVAEPEASFRCSTPPPDPHEQLMGSSHASHVSKQYTGSVSSSMQSSSPMENLMSGALKSADPFSLVRSEIDCVSERLRRCIISEIPTLERAAEYFFRAGAEGKRLRSTILLLLSNSLAKMPPDPQQLTVDDAPPDEHPEELRRRQQRIAEITELIHVASLLHDDVIDEADTRRGLKALNSLFGNKVAILAGDFLLARASVSLASLQNPEVIALMSQVLEHLVAGEVIQLTAGPDEALSMELYLKKSFYKTASLMANSCKSIAVLAGCDRDACQAAWDYGRHLGLSFQLVDDILDFTGSAVELGKPAGNDVRAGLATAPVLFAAEERSELVPLIRRRFRRDGDVEAALEMVGASRGLAKARSLAETHAGEARAALSRLPPVVGECAVESQRALGELTRKVLTRRK